MIITFKILNVHPIKEDLLRFEVITSLFNITYELTINIASYIIKNKNEISLDTLAIQKEITDQVSKLITESELAQGITQAEITWQVEARNESISTST